MRRAHTRLKASLMRHVAGPPTGQLFLSMAAIRGPELPGEAEPQGQIELQGQTEPQAADPERLPRGAGRGLSVGIVGSPALHSA